MVWWLRENPFARWIMTVLRIWIGWEWMSGAVGKIGDAAWTGPQAGAGVALFLNSALGSAHGTHPSVQAWYASFIRGFALPNAKLLSFLIPWGELLVGIALILGFFSTFAALMGAVMNMSFLLAGAGSINPDLLIAELFLLIAGYNAAVYGVDYWVIPWFRRLLRYEVEPHASEVAERMTRGA